MATNFIMVGAATAARLPISAVFLEAAVRLNGVSVDMNLLAFRWGMAVVDAKRGRPPSSSPGQGGDLRVLEAEARAIVGRGRR